VIKFDIPDSISQSSEISKVQLSIWCTDDALIKEDEEHYVENGNKANIFLYKLTKSWNEAEVTFLNADSSTPWESVHQSQFTTQVAEARVVGGGDYDTSTITMGSTNFGGEKKSKSWVTFDVTDIVKDMIDNPADNNGFMILDGRMLSYTLGEVEEGKEESGKYINFGKYNSFTSYASSEYPDIAKHPKLEIKYK
jgi:hypothetical protein